MIERKTVSDEYAGKRLDEAVSGMFVQVSRTEARRIIDRGGCAVNRSMVRVASRTVCPGDVIEVGIMEPGRFSDLTLAPEDLLFENRELIGVNKPAGINTQRTPYQLKGTLEYWVTEFLRQQGKGEPCRVVHRLDRGTSGAMVFPKHRQAAAWLSSRFHDNVIEKRYLALVSGQPVCREWETDAPIGKVGSARYGVVTGGKEAVTRFRVVATSSGSALVEAQPLTGRTHQIRVHLLSAGLPIVGDGTYGNCLAPRMMLHCASLQFRDERDEEIVIRAPFDKLFRETMEAHGVVADPL